MQTIPPDRLLLLKSCKEVPNSYIRYADDTAQPSVTFEKLQGSTKRSVQEMGMNINGAKYKIINVSYQAVVLDGIEVEHVKDLCPSEA